MDYVLQFGIITGIVFVSEAIKYFLPLPIPSSIYGLVLVLVLLKTGIIKLSKIDKAGTFLTKILSITFIPVSVGVMQSFDQLKSLAVPMLVIIFISTLAIFAVTGLLSQKLMLRNSGGRK